LYVDENYHIIKNEKYCNKLEQNRLTNGLDKFVMDIRYLIVLPNDIKDYPNKKYIKEINKIRHNIF
jgi:hypothetical protein